MLENPILLGLGILLGTILILYIGYKLIDDIKLIFTKKLQIKWIKKPDKPEKEPKEKGQFPMWMITGILTIGVCCVVAAVCGILIVVKLFIEAA